MGFVHWVGGLFSSIPRKILDGYHAVVHAFGVIWHLLTELGHLIGGAWVHFVHATERFATDVEHLAAATYHAFDRLLVHTLPRLLAAVAHDAARLATRLAHDVKAWAVDAYHAALTFAARVAADVKAWALDVFRWVKHRLAEAWTLARHLARIVGRLLTDPERLAIWVFGALWRYARRQIWRDSEKIARWVLAHAVRATLRGAVNIESVLADIF